MEKAREGATHEQDVSLQAPTFGVIFRTWWPLAASWALMAAELPVISAIVARLPEPEVNLAAYGGVVFALALIIESPIIMLLAASTALSKDWASYALMRRFMMITSAALTLLHALVAFTPLYYVVVEGMLGAPAEIVEPGRIGLMIMLPWTWSIAYRRFNQGVLIRFGHSRAVGVGTTFRLGADVIVLGIGYAIGTIPGIVVATTAVAAGVVSEAVYTGFRVRPVLKYQLKAAAPVKPPLTYPVFCQFYVPLVFTALLSLLAQPIGMAAVSRMPNALSSLAAWPVLSGLVFMVRSLGMAYNEVVVALLDRPSSLAVLRRFALMLATVSTGVLLVFTVTPLAEFWFGRLSALRPELAALALSGLWIALPLPALSVAQSWFQGIILNSRRTRIITESMALYLGILLAILFGGVAWGKAPGLYVGVIALTLSSIVQVGWLALRSRPAVRALRDRDARSATALAPGVVTPLGG
jgi:hypothetical protein